MTQTPNFAPPTQPGLISQAAEACLRAIVLAAACVTCVVVALYLGLRAAWLAARRHV